jgi:hypothetical protein
MSTVPLAQPYIPKTMGHMVWVCGTALVWRGTLSKLPLKKKDLVSILGSAIGTIGPLLGTLEVSQPLKKFKALGQSAILAAAGSEKMCRRGKRAATFASMLPWNFGNVTPKTQRVSGAELRQSNSKGVCHAIQQLGLGSF